jgi:hypothetical protein
LQTSPSTRFRRFYRYLRPRLSDRGADDIVDGRDARQRLKRRTEPDQSAPGVWREETVQVRIEFSLDVLPFNRVLGAPAPVQYFACECAAVDRIACPDAEPLTAQPFVSIDALAALSALLDLALKDRTPSVALPSGPNSRLKEIHNVDEDSIHAVRERVARCRRHRA